MKIAGTTLLPFPPERAYELMQDPAVLSRAIPGCESLDRTGEGEYRMKMKMMLAGFSGAFEGKVRLIDPVPPTSFRTVVEGSGKIGPGRTRRAAVDRWPRPDGHPRRAARRTFEQQRCGAGSTDGRLALHG